MFYYYDPTYSLVLIGVVICMLASSRVNHVFRRYASVRSMSGMTGREAAERILRANGIYDVQVCHISGHLNDHYDPRNKILRLSDATYNSPSVAAIGVAAHECGHAVQHAVGYAPLKIRGSARAGGEFRFDPCMVTDLDRTSDPKRCGSPFDQSGNPFVFRGGIVPDRDIAGGIQCIEKSGAGVGKGRDALRRRDRRNESGASGGGADYEAARHHDPAASASHYNRRKKTG